MGCSWIPSTQARELVEVGVRLLLHRVSPGTYHVEGSRVEEAQRVMEEWEEEEEEEEGRHARQEVSIIV